jgi:choline kinase
VREAVGALAGSLTIRFAECPDPSAPNGVSLLAAAPFAGPRFFLQMVDHLFAEPTLPALAAEPLGPGEVGRVLVDRQPPKDLDLEDATKVRVEAGRVEAIGKGLEPWHAIDAGCFLLTPGVFDALREVSGDEPLTVSSGMRRLAARRALGAASINGIAWIDLDTPLDLEAAERLLFALR